MTLTPKPVIHRRRPPAAETLTFDSSRSRCTTPAACAAPTAAGHLTGDLLALGAFERLPRPDLGQCRARDVLAGDVRGSIRRRTGIEHFGGGWMLQARQRRLQLVKAGSHRLPVAIHHDLERHEAANAVRVALGQVGDPQSILLDRRQHLIGPPSSAIEAAVANRQAGQSPWVAASEARGRPHCGHAIRCGWRHETAFSRYAISASMSAGSDTVSPICSTSTSRK